MTKPAGYEWGPWLPLSLWRSVDISGLTVQVSDDGDTYRVQIPDTSEPAQTKPYVDPDWLADWVQWIARNEDGDTYVFAQKPQALLTVWAATCGKRARLYAVKHELGTCDWTDSLVSREELEDEKKLREAIEDEMGFATWGGR